MIFNKYVKNRRIFAILCIFVLLLFSCENFFDIEFPDNNGSGSTKGAQPPGTSPGNPSPANPKTPDPVPADPDPEEPEPDDPEPDDPDPDNPDPDDPEPDDPDPDDPEPDPQPDPEPDPEPDNPDPDEPEPVEPDPDNPDPVDPDPEDPDPVDPEPKDPVDPGKDIKINFLNVITDGNSTGVSSTKITLRFNKLIPDLALNDVTLTPGTGIITKTGIALAESDNWDLFISDFTNGANISVNVSKAGYEITGGPNSVTVYVYPAPEDPKDPPEQPDPDPDPQPDPEPDPQPDPEPDPDPDPLPDPEPDPEPPQPPAPVISVLTVTKANGSSTSTTTQLYFNFTPAVSGFSVTNISFGTSGVTATSISGGPAQYTVTISGVTSTSIPVSVTNPQGYVITNSTSTVAVNFYTPPVQPPGGDDGAYTGKVPSVPQSRTFLATNVVTDADYSLTADLLYEGEKCLVWGETAAKVSDINAYNMAFTFDRTIYPRMMAAFDNGENFYDNNEIVANSALGYASWMTNGDGRLNILLLDIKDGYTGNGGYVGGYFSSIDLFDYSNSNKCAMIYVDTNPGLNNMNSAYGTLAHEFQHLLNYVTSRQKRSGYTMDTWINEGLSTACEYIWTGTQATNRINNYNSSSTIPNGNNFYVWGSSGTDVLDDYATVYLFFQWLRVQSGGMDIYKDILYSTDRDYNSVTKAAFKYGLISINNDWPTLLKNWLAANYINAPDGLYGYKNEASLRTVQARVTAKTGNSATAVPLLPGEGIYTSNTAMPAVTNLIRYAGLPSRGSTGIPNDTSSSGSAVMLSYNTNTTLRGTAENAFPFSNTVIGRSLGATADTIPVPVYTLPDSYPISIEDMRRLLGK